MVVCVDTLCGVERVIIPCKRGVGGPYIVLARLTSSPVTGQLLMRLLVMIFVNFVVAPNNGL